MKCHPLIEPDRRCLVLNNNYQSPENISWDINTVCLPVVFNNFVTRPLGKSLRRNLGLRVLESSKEAKTIMSKQVSLSANFFFCYDYNNQFETRKQLINTTLDHPTASWTHCQQWGIFTQNTVKMGDMTVLTQCIITLAYLQDSLPLYDYFLRLLKLAWSVAGIVPLAFVLNLCDFVSTETKWTGCM